MVLNESHFGFIQKTMVKGRWFTAGDFRITDGSPAPSWQEPRLGQPVKVSSAWYVYLGRDGNGARVASLETGEVKTVKEENLTLVSGDLAYAAELKKRCEEVFNQTDADTQATKVAAHQLEEGSLTFVLYFTDEHTVQAILLHDERFDTNAEYASNALFAAIRNKTIGIAPRPPVGLLKRDGAHIRFVDGIRGVRLADNIPLVDLMEAVSEHVLLNTIKLGSEFIVTVDAPYISDISNSFAADYSVTSGISAKYTIAGVVCGIMVSIIEVSTGKTDDKDITMDRMCAYALMSVGIITIFVVVGRGVNGGLSAIQARLPGQR